MPIGWGMIIHEEVHMTREEKRKAKLRVVDGKTIKKPGGFPIVKRSQFQYQIAPSVQGC